MLGQKEILSQPAPVECVGTWWGPVTSLDDPPVTTGPFLADVYPEAGQPFLHLPPTPTPETRGVFAHKDNIAFSSNAGTL